MVLAIILLLCLYNYLHTEAFARPMFLALSLHLHVYHRCFVIKLVFDGISFSSCFTSYYYFSFPVIYNILSKWICFLEDTRLRCFIPSQS